ncbi:MAG: hypothetical protein HZA06_02225 [Nitrospirae bacterium]|nr:hypothetical protein [Nitrospirota bacterium]
MFNNDSITFNLDIPFIRFLHVVSVDIVAGWRVKLDMIAQSIRLFFTEGKLVGRFERRWWR